MSDRVIRNMIPGRGGALYLYLMSSYVHDRRSMPRAIGPRFNTTSNPSSVIRYSWRHVIGGRLDCFSRGGSFSPARTLMNILHAAEERKSGPRDWPPNDENPQ